MRDETIVYLKQGQKRKKVMKIKLIYTVYQPIKNLNSQCKFLIIQQEAIKQKNIQARKENSTLLARRNASKTSWSSMMSYGYLNEAIRKEADTIEIRLEPNYPL